MTLITMKAQLLFLFFLKLQLNKNLLELKKKIDVNTQRNTKLIKTK